jgi:hypothetical protein
MSRSNQNGIEAGISTLWDREKAFEDALQAHADAEHLFKVRNAEEFLKADGSVEARKAQALVNCKELHKDYLKKEAIATFTKEKLRDAQGALSARQSLLSYEARTNFGMTGAGA